MGFKFDEKLLVNNNIFKYEDKLNSAFTRFLETTPTYVTYYNINTIDSTVDLGFSNVDKILGPQSPIRFSEVKNFPIYGMEAIQLDIDDNEEGLNSSYDGELIILPDTITPYPDDFFILEHKGHNFLFRVTGVNYDTIKSNNFFKIQFTIKYVTPEDSKKILEQVTEKFTCIVGNIGTEDRCIIEDEVYILLQRMQYLYNDICKRYLMFYYNKRYNAVIYYDSEDGLGIYDRYLNAFIQKHGLFYDRDSHRALYLNNEDDTCCFPLEYDNSLYRTFESRKKIKRYPYNNFKIQEIKNIYSVFRYYSAKVYSVRFREGSAEYFPHQIIDRMVDGTIPDKTAETEFMYDEADRLLVKYMNDQIESIHNIDFDELEQFTYFHPTWVNMIKVPLLLYVMKGYYKLFIRKQSFN
jgi:hypothetical protein